jgi:hypothetical protein
VANALDNHNLGNGSTRPTDFVALGLGILGATLVSWIGILAVLEKPIPMEFHWLTISIAGILGGAYRFRGNGQNRQNGGAGGGGRLDEGHKQATAGPPAVRAS